MSTNSIRCPNCGKQLRFPASTKARRGKCPSCGAVVELSASDQPVPAPPNAEQQSAPAPPIEQTPGVATDVPDFQITTEIPSVVRPRGKRQRSAASRNVGIIVGGVIAFAIAAAIYISQTEQPLPPPATPTQPVAVKPADPAATIAEEVAVSPTLAPVRGAPIDLRLMPAGVRVIIHIRPAEIWSPGTVGSECLRCLGPLTPWAEKQLISWSGFPLAEIESATFGLIPGTRGTEPNIALVVRTKTEQRQADLMTRFEAEKVEDGGRSVYIAKGRAYYFADDQKTFANVPAPLATEMLSAVNEPNSTSPHIEMVLRETDSTRPLTIVFEPLDLRVSRNDLFPKEMRDPVDWTVDWLGDDADSVAFSVGLDKELDLELIVRHRVASNQRTIRTAEALANFEQKLDALPKSVLAYVQQLAPNTNGRRQIIGRFPAMIKVTTLATSRSSEDRLLRFTANLPERAAPNLALAGRLTWEESLSSAAE